MSISEIQDRYARFAAEETRGRSELYESWALTVSTDDAVAEVVARFAEQRRQPALVFAVMRLAGAPAVTGDRWREWILAHAERILAAGEGRSVQTNEPLRCVALMPALASIAGPISLIEVGASAGICLFPDRYSYRYEGEASARWDPPAGSLVELTTAARGQHRVPLASPNIVWRAGIDLNPLDARDPADRSWLTSLVWPGETGRAERIAAALDVVAADPPLMVAGDATVDLAALVDRAPSDTTIVITTPGVLPHIPRAGRERIIAEAQRLSDYWITLDAPSLHDAWTTSTERAPDGGFALAVNGAVLAGVDPLGRWIEWFGNDSA